MTDLEQFQAMLAKQDIIVEAWPWDDDLLEVELTLDSYQPHSPALQGVRGPGCHFLFDHDGSFRGVYLSGIDPVDVE